MSSIFGGSKDAPEPPKPVATSGPPSHPPPPAPVSKPTTSDTGASLRGTSTSVSSFEPKTTTTTSSSSNGSPSAFPVKNTPQWYSPKKTSPESITGTMATTKTTDYKSASSTPKTSSLSSQDSLGQASRTGSTTSAVSPIVSGYSSMSQTSLDKSFTSHIPDTKTENRMPFSTITTQASTHEVPRNQSVIPTSSSYRKQGSSESSYTPPPSTIDKIKDIHAPLTRKDSSDSDLIFGDKGPEFYRSKYAYSTYSSTNKSSDMDVIFSASIDKRSSIESDHSFRSNSRDSSSDHARNTSSYRGIQNPMFQDYDSGTSNKPSHDEDDDFDLK